MPAHLLGPDHLVGPEPADLVAELGGPDRRHHVGAGGVAELHPGRPDAAGRPGDQQAVAGRQAGLGEQGVVGGGEHLGEPPGLRPVEPVGHRERHHLGHHHQLGLRAPADQRHHPVADREPRHRRPGRHHLAGELHPRDVLRRPRRGRVEAPALEQVGPVDAGGPHRHQQLAGPRLGIRVGPPDELVVDDGDGVHGPRVGGSTPTVPRVSPRCDIPETLAPYPGGGGRQPTCGRGGPRRWERSNS